MYREGTVNIGEKVAEVGTGRQEAERKNKADHKLVGVEKDAADKRARWWQVIGCVYT